MSAENLPPHEVLRYAAFTDTPDGGNPAGVVPEAAGLEHGEMLGIARAVGYSETAFLTRCAGSPDAFDVRYFSPEAEVPFCGHATIAAGVALADRHGPGKLVFHVSAGSVTVETRLDPAGTTSASLTSVRPHVEEPAGTLLEDTMSALGWQAPDLDRALPARVAFAGARHLILAAATRDRLARLDYDYEGLRRIMLEHDLTTVDLVWRERDDLFHARNPFPVGGVYEDPATGAAAAAFGAYLRSLELVAAPAQITIRQGEDMGRPSLLIVDIPAGDGGIAVSGGAVPIS
jgi:PhzF family phenazine biosynthesis protein